MTVIIGTTLRAEDKPLAVAGALLAARLQEPATLVHVCEDPRASMVLGTQEEHIVGSFRDDLSRHAKDLQQASGATVRPHLAAGSVADAIVSLAQFELATFVVVGPSTRKLRNIAEKVVQNSKVSVLVLHTPERITAWLTDDVPLRVLVGTDLGRTAQSARRFAAMLAQLAPTYVEVALVASPEETHARLGLRPSKAESLCKEAEAVLLREILDSAPSSEASAALRVVSGSGRADVHLLTRANEGRFDDVVVGQRRESLVEQIWHTSVARGTIKGATMNVVTVPVRRDEVDRSFRSPQAIVVGVNFSETDHRALSHAIGHAAAGARIHIVHLLGSYDSPSVLEQARENARYRLSKLQNDAHEAGNHISVETHILEGIPLEQLLALSERVGADLVVLGARKRSALARSMMGSLTRSVIEKSRFPVLLVPERRP